MSKKTSSSHSLQQQESARSLKASEGPSAPVAPQTASAPVAPQTASAPAPTGSVVQSDRKPSAATEAQPSAATEAQPSSSGAHRQSVSKNEKLEKRLLEEAMMDLSHGGGRQIIPNIKEEPYIPLSLARKKVKQVAACAPPLCPWSTDATFSTTSALAAHVTLVCVFFV